MSGVIKDARRIVSQAGGGTGGSGVASVTAGTNITITGTATNPIINSTADDITVVANYSALPAPGTVTGQFYWCSASQGTRWIGGLLFGGTYYNSGLYYSTGLIWESIETPYQATQVEVNTGTNTDKFVTPSTLTNSDQIVNLHMTTLGDTLYGGALGVATRLGGNTTSTQKFLSQTGDGTNSAAPSWQVIPSAGLQIFFMYNTASSIGGAYLQQKTPASTGAIQSINSGSVATGTIIGIFATNAGFPGVTFIPPGVATVYIQAAKIAGGGNTQLFADIYTRTTGGVETLISTTALSPVLTAIQSAYIIQGAIPTGIITTSTDRIVTKVRVQVSSGSVTVVLQVEDNTSARTELPSATVDATNFIPYTGATLNVDLGSKTLTTTGAITGLNFVGTFAGNTWTTGANTLTLAGNLITTGAFNTTFAAGFTGTLTLPTATATLYSTQTASITSAQLATSLTDETGTGVAVFGTSPTFTTSIIAPLVIGGAGTTSTLTYRTTSNAGGTTGADHIWQSGNNGATELMRLINAGSLIIGAAAIRSTGSILSVQKSQNSAMLMEVVNVNAGSGAYTGILCDNGTSTGAFYQLGSSWTTSGGFIQNGTSFVGGGSGGMSICAIHASGGLGFYTGGFAAGNLKFALTSAGLATWTTAYHVFAAGTATAGTAPVRMTSSGTGLTGLLTVPVSGAIEFTTYGLWLTNTAAARNKVWEGLIGASAPATNNIGVILDYYGTSATRVLTTPNTWATIVGDDGNTYKIPCYS